MVREKIPHINGGSGDQNSLQHFSDIHFVFLFIELKKLKKFKYLEIRGNLLSSLINDKI